MARIAYRCMKCRTRNCLRKYLEAYMRPPRCKFCGNKTFYWDTERNTKVIPCICSGYAFFHRPGSRYCHQNPNSLANEIADRSTEEDRVEMFLDAYFDSINFSKVVSI